MSTAGPQLVKREPLGQVRSHRGGAVEPDSFAMLYQEEVEKDFTLRGQQAGIGRRVRRQFVDVTGDQSLQEAARVGARQRENGAVGQCGKVAV